MVAPRHFLFKKFIVRFNFCAGSPLKSPRNYEIIEKIGILINIFITG